MLAFLIFGLVRSTILDRDDPIVSARRTGPFFFFFVFFIIGLVTLFKGLKNLNLDFDLPQAFLLSLVLGVRGLRCSGRGSSGACMSAPEDPKDAFAQVERVFVVLQILTACAVAFAHGSNDVANSIGPLAALTKVALSAEVGGKAPVEPWMLALGGIGIVFGLATWGYRVMETVGKKITELTPSRGFAAELAAAHDDRRRVAIGHSGLDDAHSRGLGARRGPRARHRRPRPARGRTDRGVMGGHAAGRGGAVDLLLLLLQGPARFLGVRDVVHWKSLRQVADPPDAAAHGGRRGLRPRDAALRRGHGARATSTAMEAHRDAIVRLEHEADEIKHEIRSHLPRRFFMAVERRDMLEILDAQDSIADVAQDIAELADDAEDGGAADDEGCAARPDPARCWTRACRPSASSTSSTSCSRPASASARSRAWKRC